MPNRVSTITKSKTFMCIKLLPPTLLQLATWSHNYSRDTKMGTYYCLFSLTDGFRELCDYKHENWSKLFWIPYSTLT